MPNQIERRRIPRRTRTRRNTPTPNARTATETNSRTTKSTSTTTNRNAKTSHTPTHPDPRSQTTINQPKNGQTRIRQRTRNPTHPTGASWKSPNTNRRRTTKRNIDTTARATPRHKNHEAIKAWHETNQQQKNAD